MFRALKLPLFSHSQPQQWRQELSKSMDVIWLDVRKPDAIWTIRSSTLSGSWDGV